MPSFNNPKVTNPINSDISEIRELLQILAKQDYTGVDDTPTGAKRITTVTGGMQLQNFSNNSWSSIGKLMHDVDRLDGYHASTTATKGTIPVYNASAQLPGSITGNAATATKLASKKTIDIGGIATADAVGFDGSGNITIPINSINVSNDDDSALVGIVSKAHGGTGRNDGAAADVILANGGKASEYGQIGDAVYKNGTTDLNTLVVSGCYACDTNQGLNYNHPMTMASSSAIVVVKKRNTAIYQSWREMRTAIMFARFSLDSGASWSTWQPIGGEYSASFKIYISKSGSDNNTGLDSSHPVLTINRALAIANILHPSNAGTTVSFYIGEGDWGSITLNSLPYYLQITSYSGDNATEYSDSLPHFFMIFSRGSTIRLGSIVCNYIDASLNGAILISPYYIRLAAMRARHGGVIEIDGGSSGSYPIEIISKNDHDSVYNVYNFGQICHLGGRTVKVVENLNLYNAFIISNTHSDISFNGVAIQTNSGVTVTGKKYQVNKASSVSGVTLDSLPGTVAGTKEKGAIIEGIPYGGGAADEALMADLSWKPVLLQTGGKVSGELVLERNQIPLVMTMSDIEWGVTPSSDKFSGFSIYEKTRTKRIGFIQLAERSSGIRSFELCINDDNEKSSPTDRLRLIYDKNNDIWYATAPTPPDSSTDREIVTAAWANKNIGNKLTKYLPLAGGTMTGSISVAANTLIQSTPWSGISIADSTRSDNSEKIIGQVLDKNGKRLITLEAQVSTDGSRSLDINGRNRADTGWVHIFRVTEKADNSIVGTLGGKNIVRSVNGANADVNGNVVIDSVDNATHADTAGSVEAAGYLATCATSHRYNTQWYVTAKTPNFGNYWFVYGSGIVQENTGKELGTFTYSGKVVAKNTTFLKKEVKASTVDRTVTWKTNNFVCIRIS